MTPPPIGRPTTSTERMRLKRLREQGLVPAVKTCKVCGKTLKQGAGANKAWELGLCWTHWRQSAEGKLERRRQNLKSKEAWAVQFFGIKHSGEITQHSKIRDALMEVKHKGGRDNGLVVVVWSDGRITMHAQLTVAKAKGLRPEMGDLLLDGWERFDDLTPDELKSWFYS